MRTAGRSNRLRFEKRSITLQYEPLVSYSFFLLDIILHHIPYILLVRISIL